MYVILLKNSFKRLAWILTVPSPHNVFISLYCVDLQLLSQLELTGEEIGDEISRSKEVLEEDGEDQLLALLKNKDHSVIMKNQQAENTKVVQHGTPYMPIKLLL